MTRVPSIEEPCVAKVTSTVLKASGGGDPFAEPNRNAFYRLAARLKGYFPRLPILLLLDGLYPNGPLMALCRQ